MHSNNKKEKKIQTRATLIIADINPKPVPSPKTCEEVNLIKRILKINCNSDSLQGLIDLLGASCG